MIVRDIRNEDFDVFIFAPKFIFPRKKPFIREKNKISDKKIDKLSYKYYVYAAKWVYVKGNPQLVCIAQLCEY